jgi:DNA-binding transcriptional LysR family regulator
MRKMPPLNAIRAFEAAARHRSFTTAAKELGVTVTAVSHQIRHLEASLGVKLFERSARAVSLTPAGEKFIRCCGMDLTGWGTHSARSTKSIRVRRLRFQRHAHLRSVG